MKMVSVAANQLLFCCGIHVVVKTLDFLFIWDINVILYTFE